MWAQAHFVEQLVVRPLHNEVVNESIVSIRDAVLQSSATLLVLRVYVGAVSHQGLHNTRIAILTRNRPIPLYR